MERSESVYGNVQKPSTVKKAEKSKLKYINKFGDDTGADYSAEVVDNEYIGDILGVKNVEIGKNTPGTCLGFDIDNGIIVGKPQDEEFYEEYKAVYLSVLKEFRILSNVNIL